MIAKVPLRVLLGSGLSCGYGTPWAMFLEADSSRWLIRWLRRVRWSQHRSPRRDVVASWAFECSFVRESCFYETIYKKEKNHIYILGIYYNYYCKLIGSVWWWSGRSCRRLGEFEHTHLFFLLLLVLEFQFQPKYRITELVIFKNKTMQ